MTVVYYLGLFFCNAVTTFSLQKYGKAMRNKNDIFIYALTTGIMSMLFFWITSGFSIVLNGKTVFYSVVLTVTSILSYFTQLLVYKYMGVAEVSVITTGGKLLFSSVAGIILFSEKVGLVSVLRIALMLLSVLLLFLQNCKISKGKEKHKSVRAQSLFSFGLLLCLLIICIGVVSTVVSKYIAIDTNVTSSNSLFFFTNFLISCFSVASLLFGSRCHHKKFISIIRSVSFKQYLTIITKTVAGSFSSVLGILILAEGDVSLYVPLSNALGLLATQAVAVVILRERPLILPLIPAILSMLLAFYG